MKFNFFSRVSDFFRRIFSVKQRFSDERTYSKNSFVSHIDDRTFFQLTSQESGVLAPSTVDQMPDITIYWIYGASVGVAEALSETNLDDAEQAAKQQYIDAVNEGRVVSSQLFKLTHVINRQVHLIRRIDDVNSADFKRMDKVQRLLGSYAVKLFSHRIFLNPEATSTEYTYINEMECISGLRKARRYLKDFLVVLGASSSLATPSFF